MTENCIELKLSPLEESELAMSIHKVVIPDTNKYSKIPIASLLGARHCCRLWKYSSVLLVGGTNNKYITIAEMR